MKKRGLALLCMLALLIGLVPTMSRAADELYFIALNDSLPERRPEVTPIRVNGATYIPCTVFDSRYVPDANLGVTYTQDRTAGTVTLYDEQQLQLLEFNIDAGTAFSYSDSKTYSYQAVVRNGLPYVPTMAVCNYFGLTATFYVLDSGPLLRIKNEAVIMDDKMFLSSATPILANRAKEYRLQQQAQQGEKGPTTTAPPPVPDGETSVTPPEVPEEKPAQEDAAKGVGIYLGIRMQPGGSVSGPLSALKQAQVRAIFFFRPEDLVGYDDALRQIVGSGHRVGLIPKGETAAGQLASLEEGNRLLEHILRQRTAFALSAESGVAQEALQQAGYLCWSPQVNTAGMKSTTMVQTVQSKVEKRRRATRVLLHGGLAEHTMTAALGQWKGEGYDLRVSRETDYGS